MSWDYIDGATSLRSTADMRSNVDAARACGEPAEMGGMSDISPEVATEIVDWIADQLEAQRHDAHDNWAGGDWRIGRTSRHVEIIYERALEMVPPVVRDAYALSREEAA